jgi:phosphoribosylanthranilate isomerase
LAPVFVKICGLTNAADALMAVAMGADALGFIFAPSVRQIGVEDVSEIVGQIPDDVLTVGVFRDESAQHIVDVVAATGLGGVQLHGRESPGEAKWIRARVPFVVQAFGAGDPRLDRVDDYEVDAVLLDAAVPGSGHTFAWDLVGDLPRRRDVILAGGLRPENIVDAIRTVRPWGVDVASGVESSPGRKDVRRVRRFIALARDAATEPTEPVPFDDDVDGFGDPDLGDTDSGADVVPLFDERR